jgi:hypothetical protein
MRTLLAIGSFGSGFYFLWTGAPVQENFVAIGLIGFAFLLELSSTR